MDFIDFNIISIIDITLVAILMYQLYKLVKGTVAINIFIGIVFIYMMWKLFEALKMEMVSEILGQFISLGVIALLIVFQQELREFLLMIGGQDFLKKIPLLGNLKLGKINTKINITPIIEACKKLSEKNIGALLIIFRTNTFPSYSENGTKINAELSSELIQNIFFKNSPLHDGAMCISNNKILSAGCVLPVTDNPDMPSQFGLRHLAAIGGIEHSDDIAIVISEETGKITFIHGNDISQEINISDLEKKLTSLAN